MTSVASCLPFVTSAMVSANASRSSAVSSALGCSRTSSAGASAIARAKCTRARIAAGASPVTTCNARANVRLTRNNPALTRELHDLLRNRRRHRIDFQREGHRQVLRERRALEQNAARADDTEAIERGEPLVAACDVGCALSEHPDLTLVGHARAGHEVDQHLRGAGVEAADRHALAGPIVSACTRRGRRL